MNAEPCGVVRAVHQYANEAKELRLPLHFVNDHEP